MSIESKDDVLKEIQKVFGELFELSVEQVTLDADLNEDLGLDSIDAVDMVIRLQEITGRKLSPDQFKAIHYPCAGDHPPAA